MKILKEKKMESASDYQIFREHPDEVKTIDELIDFLKEKAKHIQNQPHRLNNDDLLNLQTIQHTISWLIQSRKLINPASEKPIETANFITYKIISDMGDKLKSGARTACNFWNRFIQPRYSIVIRLGTFTQSSNTIARAYKPYVKEDVHYSRIEFNTRYLGQFTPDEIAGTIIHEIGHSLGIGWEKWDSLFFRETGLFKSEAIKQLKSLKEMEVELEGGPGTALAHWDEEKFDQELMTGYQDHGEYVLPVTIDLMAILGHTINERLDERKNLAELIQDATAVVFSRQDEVKNMDIEHYEETELLENIPHE